MTEIEQAIVKTLVWFDIFNYPLTSWELYKFLWLPRSADRRGTMTPTDAENISYKKIRNTLQSPSTWLTERIEQQGAWYFLPGKSWLTDRRQKQHMLFKKRWTRARKMALRASLIPHLKTFALCNTFSLEHSQIKSDLDTFVIAGNNRIWLVRLLLTGQAFLLRKWRHGQHVANRFCLSFFITPAEADLSKIARQPYDIYLAYWVAFLAPLYGANANNFFKANAWVKDKLPNWTPRWQSRKYEARPRLWRRIIKKLFELILSGPLGNLLENLARTLQKKHMRDISNYPVGSIIISDQMLKFHNEDRRDHFRDLWEHKVNALLN